MAGRGFPAVATGFAASTEAPLSSATSSFRKLAQFLTVTYSCSNITIWRLRRDGKLPKPEKLGNRNVTLEDDVDRAMELLVGA